MNLTNNTSLCFLVTAAGSSTRMGGSTKKEYLPLDSGTVLSTILKKILKYSNPCLIAVTVPDSDNSITEAKNAVFCDHELNSILDTKRDVKILFTKGAQTRQASVFNGLKILKENLPEKNESKMFVAIHDGARPFISEDLIFRTVQKAFETGAAFPGLEPTETQKQIDEEGFVNCHLKRKNLISVQTPQVFEFEKIFKAHTLALKESKENKNGKEYTDDTEIYGNYFGKVATVKGTPENIKITYPKDYQRGKPMIHTGLGYDMHRLIAGRKLMLGGIHIPFEKGEDGHSDGDVLLHAITDALLGASGLGDIGSFFPPEEPEWKDADSKILLKTVWNKIKEKGWKLENLDCVIKLEKPKFIPYREEVIKSIAELLEADAENIFVKAKTYEKTGNWENQIEAFATCLLSR